jgi:acetyl esterase/lipase
MNLSSRLLVLLLLVLRAVGEEVPGVTRTEVIYGRKFGTALTLDVLRPQKTNGHAVVWVVSGGYFSSHDGVNPAYVRAFLDRGYTVFAVVHGSQPKFTIPEAVQDIHRAVRWVRHHAAEHGVRPDRIGITGASAGGHLSLTLGTRGDDGDPGAKDPVDRESSRVQAVACFFPPTDFRNWARPGDTQVGVGRVGRAFYAAFGPRSDTPEGRGEYGREISPVEFVDARTAPTLVVHGEADGLVPIYQAEIFEAKCRSVGAVCKIVRLPGKDHGWAGMEKDIALFADWFDERLRGVSP